MFRKTLVVFVIVQYFMGLEAIKDDAKDLKCKGHDVDITEEDMGIVVECAMDLGITSKEQMTPDKIPCFGKCMIEKKGLFDSEGKLHLEKIDNMMDKNWPPALMEEGKKHLMACINEHGPKIDAKDATCKTFEPLTSCIHKAFLELCVE